MGVTGLWKLIESSGKPVPVETLENKVLAIDISIWLHQVVKGFQDGKGGNLPNAHLLGLFHRLCKLLYYRVKPVFIFDGGIPQLKRDTIAKRSQNRQKLQSEADRIQDLILQNLVRDKVVQKALGQDVCESLISPTKQKALPEKPHKDEMFKLPSLPDETKTEACPDGSSSFCSDSTSEADSSYEESNLRNTYHINLQAIDVTSDSFKNLPADVRHEILTDIKEMRKQSSWGRLHELPPAAIDFSGFQMKRLLKRRQVQVSLEQAEQQMEGKSLTLAELETLMSEEGILQASKANAAKRIASDENTRFLLVKDLKKAVENAQKDSKDGVKMEVKDEKNDNSGAGDLGGEYEADLQKAIEMSLNSTQVYKDDDYAEDGVVTLNEVQRKELKTAVTSLARGYMLEYGGMNDDDIRDLIHDQGEELHETGELQSSFNFKHNDRFVLKGEICTPYKSIPAIKDKVDQLGKFSENANKEDVQYISSSSDDSDLEEVIESNESKKAIHPSLQIVVDPTQGACDEKDDLFADIFQSGEICENMGKTCSTQENLVMKPSEEGATSNTSSIEPKKSSINQLETDENDDKIVKIDTKIGSIESEEKEKSIKVTSSAAEILQKLKEEMNKVQSITLDAIGIGAKDTIENSVNNATTKDALPEEMVSEKDETNQMKACTEETEENANAQECDITSNIRNVELGNTSTVNLHLETCDTASTDEKLDSEKNISGTSINKIQSERCANLSKAMEDSKISDLISTSPQASASKLDEILKYVKEQTNEVATIRLDDINPSESNAFVINDSDESDVEIISSTTPPESKVEEVIEIADDQKAKLKTPSKGQSSIENFFESKFTIKKTPEENDKEESPPPGVASPFFVNKSSSGGQSVNKRRSQTADDGLSQNSKVAKKLFDGEIKIEESDSGLKPLEPAKTSADVIEEAAQLLRENKTQSELENIAGDIRNENRALEVERNRQSRMGTSITDKMAGECKELLRLFGIPYIVAPMEAEAQCAFLDAMELTDGTITDDSDVWLFGGRTVYKNFFNQKKHVLEFRMENIEKLFNMDRHKLIQLAMLVGSDYTTGVNGIGAVTAIEILAHFPITPMKDGETTEIMSILSSLRKFRDWWQCSKTMTLAGRNALRSKLKNVELYEGFPNMNIAEAYLRPTVDDNRGRFSWGDPDIETIREFAKTKFGWTRMKTDEILQPVIKKLNERKTQASIKNYFAVKSATTVRDLKVSKRVMNAIDRMSGDYVETPPKKAKEPKIRKKKTSNRPKVDDGNKAVDPVVTESNNHEVVELIPPQKKVTRKRRTKPDEVETVEANHVDLDKEEAIQNLDVPNKKKTPVIPDPNRPIPQREKDKEEMELKKKHAIEIFKKKKVVIK